MSDNYWEKRAIDIESLTQERADVDIMHVNKLFDGAIEIIEKQIDEIFDKYARDSGLTQDSALKLLNEKQTDTLRRNLMTTLAQCQEEVARQAILARLNAPAYAARISRLEALKDLVHAQAYKVGSAAHYRLTDRLIDTYEQSYYRSIYDQQRRSETGFDFTKLADRDVQAAIATKWAGSNYSDRIWKNTKKLAESLEDVITQGLMTGQSIRDMELALEAKVDSGRYNINRVIRTEVNHCCNQGTLMSYKAAGTLRYIYLATLDMRTSSICRSLDKEVFFVSKAKVGVNFPPMHPNCRSTTMAYPEDGIFPKERTARNPETNKNIHVPFDMSYAQWYRKYVLEKKDVDNHQESVRIKKIELPPETDNIKGMSQETKQAICDAFDKVKEEYNVSINNMELESLGNGNERVPFQYVPKNIGGFLKYRLVINTDYDFNGSLDAFSARIMRNHNNGFLSSENVEDLIAHEMAHILTFQDCDTFGVFTRVEEEVREKFIKGVSAYADSTYDGAETIAEAFVKYRKGERLPDNVMSLLEKYVLKKEY